MGRIRGYQRHRRFTKRLEARFGSGGMSFAGISSNLSESGLFIRTNRGFVPDTIIDIQLLMPDGKISFLKGLVKRTTKTQMATLKKNGMGIELLEIDETYMNFLKSFNEETETPAGNVSPPEFQIISCQNCGVKNKVPSGGLSLGPKCGSCGISLIINTPCSQDS